MAEDDVDAATRLMRFRALVDILDWVLGYRESSLVVPRYQLVSLGVRLRT